MKGILKPGAWAWALIVVFAALFVSAGVSFSEESAFRKEFREKYLENDLNALATIVKQNKAIIPGEVSAIVKEALTGDKAFAEKMELLDLANTMASMHKYWHGDEKTLSEVERVMKEELKKEEERKAESEKWKAYEQVLGNFALREKRKEMEAKGLAPVLYPHWLHTVWYDCKACHEGLFKAKRGANSITREKILAGDLCGKCHDGKLAFGAKDDCERCHTVGKPGEERLRDVKKVDLRMIKEGAAKAGSKWDPRGLPQGQLPVDKFGFIDWMWLRKVGAYEPVKSLEKDSRGEVRDSSIIYESKMAFMNSVLFNHKTHSASIECATCHPSIFKAELGANKATQSDMAEGRACGYCHGKTAFKMADCSRCHTVPAGAPREGHLIHQAK